MDLHLRAEVFGPSRSSKSPNRRVLGAAGLWTFLEREALLQLIQTRPPHRLRPDEENILFPVNRQGTACESARPEPPPTPQL